MSVVGRGVVDGYLTKEEVSALAREGLEKLPLDGKRVIVLIPDGTRTMPMALMFDVLERVRKIVIEHLDADPEKVTEKASFIDDLGADSLDNVELVMAFEEEFDIEIPDDAAEHIQTVGDAVKFIAERLGG